MPRSANHAASLNSASLRVLKGPNTGPFTGLMSAVHPLALSANLLDVQRLRRLRRLPQRLVETPQRRRLTSSQVDFAKADYRIALDLEA